MFYTEYRYEAQVFHERVIKRMYAQSINSVPKDRGISIHKYVLNYRLRSAYYRPQHMATLEISIP